MIGITLQDVKILACDYTGMHNRQYRNLRIPGPNLALLHLSGTLTTICLLPKGKEKSLPKGKEKFLPHWKILRCQGSHWKNSM
jgi:hypothetical protein